MSHLLTELLMPDVIASAAGGNDEWLAYCAAVDAAHLEPAELPSLVRQLSELAGRPDLAPMNENAMGRFWSAALEKLWCGMSAKDLAKALDVATVDRIAKLYRDLTADNPARHQLLRLLAGSGQRSALETFTRLVASDPPRESNDVLLAFVPLFQLKTYPPDAIFPTLLDAMQGPMLATVVLDLANYLTSSGRVQRHPAAGRVERLSGLLGAVVNRLARLEERPDEYARSPAELNQIVSDSTGLIVSLTNALALIGDPRVAGKLHQTLSLSHRRVRTEAASALARLGDERGTAVLVDMTAEPVVRLRALATLEEIEQLEKVPEQYRSAAARAEAELAVRLALPTYFGAPPQSLEMVDTCRQHWPGYEEAVDCYLFRYEYHFADRTLQGIGIAGPVVHAFRADLADLPPHDIYAAYAGWATEHNQIREVLADDLAAEDREAWQTRRQQLIELGYESPLLVKAGAFFGQLHYVATSRWHEKPGILVDDGGHVEWFSSTGAARALGPDEAYYIIKGRKLLRGGL